MAMRIRLSCPSCLQQLGTSPKESSGSQSFPSPFVLVPLRDDCRYQIKCSHGHEHSVVVTNMRFELLFDAGAHALANGYAREAVADFASALEGFLLFYIRVVCRVQQVDPALIDKLVKEIKLSERRWGAMYLAHLLHTKKPFATPLDGDKWRSFRNGIVHERKICTDEKATEFAAVVYNTIRPTIISLRVGNPAEVEAEETADSAARGGGTIAPHPFLLRNPAMAGTIQMNVRAGADTISHSTIGTVLALRAHALNKSFQEAFEEWRAGSDVVERKT